MADVAEEIEQTLESKVSKILSANGSSKAGGDDDHSFDMFDNSFMESDSTLGHIPSNRMCKKLLYISICEGSSVRAWDVLLLLPSLAFTLFLAMRWTSTRRKLSSTNSAIFRVFHALVSITTLVALCRAILAMAIAGAASKPEDQADKLLWTIMLAVMMATEVSILVFWIGGPSVDSQK